MNSLETLQVVRLGDKFAQFNEFYQPKLVSQFNGHDVRLAKFKGEFVWHHHDDTDDFFLVVKGTIGIRLKKNGNTRTIKLHAGELFVVPQGMEHQPFADEEAEVLLIERNGTPNTGDPASATPAEPL